jgi:glycosyltransferase involved in cell wall biosynthesis
MRIASITAGAAGMFCGSCMRDNTLVSALIDLGHDAILIPTYTPIRTDEEDVSQKRIFFGGINVYLEQKTGIFRHTPLWFDRLLNSPGLLRWVSKFAVSVRAEELGDLTVSMLEGSHGKQRKEVEKLVDWFETDWRPDVVLLTNGLLSGIVPELKRRLNVPIVATLQGDDIFLESLPITSRKRSIDLIRDNCREVDGFIATCRYYADFMADYIGIPREKIEIVYPGIRDQKSEIKNEQSAIPTIGYFARIAPEKGLHVLADAFIHLRRMPDAPKARLRVSGWLGEHNRKYFNEILKKLDEAGLAGNVEHVESPTHADKVRFLQSLDVLSVPTVYGEPKGLYVLEALAHGVPVVQPRHGSFPELIEQTGGGLLVEPENPADLAGGLRHLLDNHAVRRELGEKGRAAVNERFTAERMARETIAVLNKLFSGAPKATAI